MNNNVWFLILMWFVLISCEEQFIPDDTNLDSKIVVESYLEKSDEGFPIYLLLSNSLSFYSEFTPKILDSIYIKADSVILKYDHSRIKLAEFCLSNLPKELQAQVVKRLGFNPDSLLIDICIYTDISGVLEVKEGVIYHLDIYKDTKVLNAQTTIPKLIGLDSLWFEDVPGKSLDSFAQLFCIIKDTPNVKNYYRYFTAGQDEPLIANFSSVTEDFFFDGKEFKFTLQKAEPPTVQFSDTLGYFKVGDSIEIKWCNIDKEHFDFWNTLEVSRTRQGPFSSYVRIDGNVYGGLGIFGGQHCQYYKILVKK